MASSNRDPVVGSVDGDNSPILRRALAVGNTVVDLVKESERSGEARAHSRLASKIDGLKFSINNLKLILKDCEDENHDLKKALQASQDRIAEADGIAKVDADARIAQYTSDLQARNAQMIDSVAETVEKLKRDAAARVAAAEAHADSQIRELSRDRDRNADMVGLARKHAAWGQHKLGLLLEKVESMGYHYRDPLRVFVFEISEDFGELRNKCDYVLDNGLLDQYVPDLGPVPDDEGGALFSSTYRNFPAVISPGNTGEEAKQPEAGASSSREGTASRTDSSPSTKRANDSEGRTGHCGKRQRTE